MIITPQAEFKHIKKILIIKLRHIGDVLLTVPAIRAVRETFPHASIEVLVNKGTEEMLTENPLLDTVIAFDRSMCKLPLYKRIVREIGFARKIRSIGFDMAINFTSGDRGALYSYLSGARYRIGYDPGGKGFLGKRYIYTHRGLRLEGREHTVFQNLSLVQQFGISTKDFQVNIYSTKQDEDAANAMLERHGIRGGGPFIHVHPTSRWLFKCWNDHSMADIIDFCEYELGIRVVITAGPDEREMKKVETIKRYLKSSPIDLSGQLTLKQLACVSTRATLFFGVDSAPMHIAAAVGTPVIALFGPSGAFDWGPWDNNFTGQGSGVRGQEKPYLKRSGVQRFGRNVVIQKDWDCVPCGKDGCDGTKVSKCLEDIPVPEVKEFLIQALEGAGNAGGSSG